MLRLALFLLLACVVPVRAETSLAGPAMALPLPVPGFETEPPPAALPAPEPAPAPAQAVNPDQIPPEFIDLMRQLDEPAGTTDIGQPPAASEIAPAAPVVRRAPAAAATGRRTEHGVQILNGNSKPQLGRSRENGVTVYRGLEPAGR